MLGMRTDVVDNPEVSQRILARTLARNQVEPPLIPGMQVDLIDVSLRIHHDGHTGWRPPGQRAPMEDPYGAPTGRRDGYPDQEGGDHPRDGYGPGE